MHFFLKNLSTYKKENTIVGATVALCTLAVIATETYQDYNLSGLFRIDIVHVLLACGIGMCAFVLASLLVAKNRITLAEQGVETETQIDAYHEKLRLDRIPTLCIYGGICTIALLSTVLFLVENPTAYEWPGIDMGPFFERKLDPSFAPTDFFTNSSSLPNPRHVFGEIILFLSSVLHTDWYGTYFLCKAVLVIAIPILFFLTITEALRKRITSDSRYLCAVSIVLIGTMLVFIDRINGIFSIGWWTPLTVSVMPQTLSLALGLLFCISALRYRNKSGLWIPLLVLSTLIHPAIGLFSFGFFLLLDLSVARWHSYAKVLCFGVLVPFGLLIYLFPTEANFSGTEFVYYYIIENHSFHYMPSVLGSFTSLPWYASFGGITMLFLLVLCAGWYRKDRFLMSIAACSLVAYTSSVLVQYVGVEVIPVKLIAAIGPIRFTFFGFWLLLFVYAYTVATIVPSTLIPITRDVRPLPLKYLKIGTGLLVLSLIVWSGAHKDDPIAAFREDHAELVAWTKRATDPDDVFVTYPDFTPADIPLLLRRPVFFGNGFPFTENGFAEHNARKSLVYGDYAALEEYPGKPYEKHAAFYRNLTPEDFVQASRSFRLDYIIVERAYSSAFDGFVPVFEDETIKIFNVTDL